MQPTRYRILEILKERGDATVAELAHLLGMAPVSVRHHLDVLQGENLIWTPRVRRRGTVGRPRQVYALTEAANKYFPQNHRLLALSMLDELKVMLSAQELEAILQRIAERMARQVSPPPAYASMEERLQRAVDFLNEHGYLARWEKEGDAFILYTLNCPYAGVAERHRELCRMDQWLLAHLLPDTPTPVSRQADGNCRCVYRVVQTDQGS